MEAVRDADAAGVPVRSASRCSATPLGWEGPVAGGRALNGVGAAYVSLLTFPVWTTSFAFLPYSLAITGFAGASLQPNAGSQGEYAGLLAIKRYHESRGDHQRNDHEHRNQIDIPSTKA